MKPRRFLPAAALLAAASLLAPQAPLHAQPGGTAGSFTRLGFGARGQGMGNALTAVSTGVLSAYYNPALTPFQQGHVLYGSYSMLTLDRRLNEIGYTQPVVIRRKGANKYPEDPDLQSISGVSAGWIGAGDAHIQGYDADGSPTGEVGVFENQFMLNFGTRFTPRLAGGINVKFYYSGFSGLGQSVTSAGFGMDVGVLYRLTDRIAVALVAQELLTKYKWDTGELYGSEHGNATDDPFLRIVRGGAAYTLPDGEGVLDAEVELYGSHAMLARLGAEYWLVPQLALRAGVERVDLGGDGIDPRPSFGVTVSQPLADMLPSVSYAFILEPVAPAPTHVLSFSLSF
jgi:hypothetical protein